MPPLTLNNTTNSIRASKVADLTRLRLSARICQRLDTWHPDSAYAGRAARRCYGSVATSSQSHDRRGAPLPETSTPPSGRPWSASFSPDQARASKPQVAPRFSVPSVLLPQEAAKSPTVHKIHILGEDERSKFIAHALSGVYDSVEMLGWRNSSSKYRNVQKARSKSHRGATVVEPIAAVPRVLASQDSSHIDQLVVTGRGHEASKALEAVKDRIDENTTVCLMNDGLGVLEDVRRRVFQGTDSTPNFLLGHMSHRLAFNRTYDSVRQLKQGQLKLFLPETMRVKSGEAHKTESRGHFVESLREVQDLRSSLTPIDEWLRFKLPSVIFDSVAEPVCVLLEMPYQGLLQNPAAHRLMQGLLKEITLVLDNLPEIEGSTVIRNYIGGKGVERLMHNTIIAKRSQPSQLARRIQKGLPTDVDYLNGYFLRRAKQLGLNLTMNTMMRDMIKAKHSQAVERLNSFIPVEEMSLPSEEAFKYRTTPQ